MLGKEPKYWSVIPVPAGLSACVLDAVAEMKMGLLGFVR